MKSDFIFYLKASVRNFTFDVALYRPKIAKQTDNFLFFANDDTNIRISEVDDGINIDLGHPRLAHAKIKWNSNTHLLEVDLDHYGLFNIYYHMNNDVVYLSNRVEILERTLSNPVLSEKSVSFFCISGFLPAGQTLWQNIHRVHKKASWDLNNKTCENYNTGWASSFTQTSGSTDLVENHIAALSDSIRTIKDDMAPQQIRLSGGADTRIVSHLWGSSPKLDAVVTHSPWLPVGEDLDVNISKAWAQKMGYSHTVLYPDSQSFAFFGEESSKPFLTGLCGGEYLGGQFHRVIPSCPNDWTERIHQWIPTKSKELLFDDPWLRSVHNDEEKWLSECARVFAQSSRSTIYHSVRGSWSSPSSLTCRVVSPFLNGRFLSLFLSTPIKEIGDYLLYKKIFIALGKELQTIPLSSQLTLIMPELKASQEWGKEPKSAKPIERLLISEERILTFLNLIFAEQQIDLPPRSIQHMFHHDKTRLYLIALYFWLRPRFNDPTIDKVQN